MAKNEFQICATLDKESYNILLTNAKKNDRAISAELRVILKDLIKNE